MICLMLPTPAIMPSRANTTIMAKFKASSTPRGCFSCSKPGHLLRRFEQKKPVRLQRSHLDPKNAWQYKTQRDKACCTY